MQTTTHAVGQSPEPVNPYAKRYIIAWALAFFFYFLEFGSLSSAEVIITDFWYVFGGSDFGLSGII
jgi:hypothetical protein